MTLVVRDETDTTAMQGRGRKISVRRFRLGFAAAAALLACRAAPALADPAKAAVEGVDDKGLRQAIERYIGTTKRAPKSRFEARRRAGEAGDDATVVLRSEGYYDYVVTPEVGDGEPPKPIIRVDPGPRSVIASPQVTWSGEPPEAEGQAQALAAVKLIVGSPGRAADVVAAEGRIVGALQKDGYADADADPRQVVVDHADHTVQPSFKIAAKTRVRLDGVQLKTKGRTNPKWVAYLAPWKTGQVYAPDKVAELERRLLDTGVYDSVGVSLSPTPDAQGLRPVVVSLADRAPSNISLGGSYSTSEGPGANVRFSTYNRFGRADTITLAAQYADILKRVDLDLTLPHWLKAERTLRVGATVYKDDTTAYDEKDIGAHVDLERHFAKTSVLTFGVAVDYSDDAEKTVVNNQIVGLRRKLELITGLARLSLDRSDDPLNPTHGWKFDGRVEPTLGAGDGTLVYAKLTAQVSGYLPLEKSASTVLAARLKLGSILTGGSELDLPASRRFFAGGGGSIRGYPYQGVGPRFPDNTPIGGQSLVEASFEARQKILSKLGAVAFVDAGTVSAEKYPDFRTFSAGAGVGLRYDLGFAPLRVDIAFPLNRRTGDGPFQVYLSIGQSF